jgi:hypothetical protein
MDVQHKSLREGERLIVHLMTTTSSAPSWLKEDQLLCLKYIAHWWDNAMVLCWSRNRHYEAIAEWPRNVYCMCERPGDRGTRPATRLCAAVPVFLFDCLEKLWKPVVLVLPQGSLRVIARCDADIFWIERKSWRETRVTRFEQRYFPPERVCDPVELLVSFAKYQIEASAARFPPIQGKEAESWQGDRQWDGSAGRETLL